EYSQITKELVVIEEEVVKLKQWKSENEKRQPIAEQENLILSKLRDAERILEGLQNYNSRIQTADESIIKSKQKEQSLIKELNSIKNSLKQKNSEYESLTTALLKVSILDIEKGKSSLDTSIEDLVDRKSTRLNSSHVKISYAVFCLK